MPEILVISYDILGEKIAGPAIRALAIAGELTNEFNVSVLYEGDFQSEKDGIRFINRDSVEINAGYFNNFDFILAPPLFTLNFPDLLEFENALMVDLFDPVIWENLVLYRRQSANMQSFEHERHLAALIAALMRGDYFIAAGRKQVDLFTGAMMILNRINPETWLEESSVEQMIGYVPFGIPGDPPPSRENSELPVEYADIMEKKIILWGGGMWDWLDPEIVVRSMPSVLEKVPDAVLVFPGTDHPNPHIPAMENVDKIKMLAAKSGLEKHIIFGNWMKLKRYRELAVNSSVCVSAHRYGLESTYAVRTRIIECIWLGIPQVVSGGDEYSDLLKKYEIGETVCSRDPANYAEAIITTIEKPVESFKPGFEKARFDLSWKSSVEPLREYLKNPRLTHGTGADFFTDVMGKASPRGKPRDLASIFHRVKSRLK
ncbi:MAG TPA: hypothetical protein VGB30_08080 [bacterium]|jgi:glycosyltransferase involved in cell wall biosynthesis